jgi:hypothetical protein
MGEATVNKTRERLYVISFEASKFKPDELKAFYVFVKNHRDVDDWHSPFPGCLFVKTEKEAGEVVGSFYEYLKFEQGLFMTELSAGSKAGFVAEESWEWLKKAGYDFDDVD